SRMISSAIASGSEKILGIGCLLIHCAGRTVLLARGARGCSHPIEAIHLQISPYGIDRSR
ncbi:hypothetical protein ABTE57_19300, partial [Acinetobacter baumannii]